MKWIFAAVIVLLVGLLLKLNSLPSEAEVSLAKEPTPVLVSLPQTEPTAAATGKQIDPALQQTEAQPAAELVGFSSALCLDGRGCTLDLQENWHLKLISTEGSLSGPELEAVFKSRNFIEAAEQLHYSRQKAADHKTELRLEQLMQAAVQKFQANPQALGCRDNLCLLQITVPGQIQIEEVRKFWSGSDLSFRTLSMTKQKSKHSWSLRFVAVVNS